MTTSTDSSPSSISERLRAYLAGSGTIWILIVLVALVILFSVAAPGAFATSYNITNLITDAAVLLILGVGMTFVIVTSGIDLSIGSVLVFSGVVGAQVMSAFGGVNAGIVGILVGLLAAVASGFAWGILNGILVAYAKIPSLIVTLGSFGMALGLAQVITNGVDVRDTPQVLGDTIGTGTIFGVPWLIIISAVVTVIGALVFAVTKFGRHTKAIGSNAEAAKRVGIRVEPHLVRVYAISGILAGLAGFLNLARFSTTTIGGHTTDNLTVIAAVVLGGTSLFGGMGTVIGTVIGVFIPAVLQNGFVIIGVQPFWQSVAVGAVLIAAVYFDQYRRRSRGRPAKRP
jgi:ribose transport system permease protein